MTKRVLATASEAGDGVYEIAAPTVGLFRDCPPAGSWLSGGSVAGRLQVLTHMHDLIIPDGVSGHVAERDHADAITAVQYGQRLFSLVPGGGDGAGMASAATSATDVASDIPGAVPVRSSTVGTFYSRPSPEQPVFAEVGKTVNPGDTLGLVEVMKVFTPVIWDRDEPGEVMRVLVDDGAEVSSGSVLLWVRPASASGS